MIALINENTLKMSEKKKDLQQMFKFAEGLAQTLAQSDEEREQFGKIFQSITPLFSGASQDQTESENASNEPTTPANTPVDGNSPPSSNLDITSLLSTLGPLLGGLSRQSDTSRDTNDLNVVKDFLTSVVYSDRIPDNVKSALQNLPEKWNTKAEENVSLFDLVFAKRDITILREILTNAEWCKGLDLNRYFKMCLKKNELNFALEFAKADWDILGQRVYFPNDKYAKEFFSLGNVGWENFVKRMQDISISFLMNLPPSQKEMYFKTAKALLKLARFA